MWIVAGCERTIVHRYEAQALWWAFSGNTEIFIYNVSYNHIQNKSKYSMRVLVRAGEIRG